MIFLILKDRRPLKRGEALENYVQMLGLYRIFVELVEAFQQAQVSC